MRNYNLCTQLYKGARALLYHIALTLQQTDFSIRDEAAASLEEMQQALHLFNGYAWMEEKYMLPAIKKYSAEAVTIFKGAHEINVALSQQLKGLLQLLQQASTSRSRQDTGHAIIRAYTSFLAAKLEHLAIKEATLSTVLQTYYTEQEVIGLQQTILNAIPVQHLAVYFRWIMRGSNNTEIINLLRYFEKTGTAQAIDLMLQMLETELPVQRWKNIQDKLAEGKVL